jgi:hypothetical protein
LAMKYLLSVWFSLLAFVSFAQADTTRTIEPGQETSFENYELLIIAIVGLLLLMGSRFWFRRTRKH